MNFQPTELCEQFRLHATRAETVVSKAGAERIAVRPRSDSWSAAECLAHLTLSTEVFLPVWRAAFAGLALDRIKVASPVDPRVRYNVWSSFNMTDAHQRRHLWQAERALGLSQ
jgi:hypothetical protein